MTWNRSSSVRENRPVILGTGLTGLAISRALSSTGIAHVLVGDRPPDRPRLGESLNAEGSLEVARQFPDFARFFFDKRRQALFFGQHALSFDSVQYAAGPAHDRLLGYPSTVRLLHVDRVGFDRNLFEAVSASEHCLHLEGRAAALDYNPVTDRIDGVRLANGETIGSTYVFDATNQTCFAARKIGVRRSVLGKARRVVFAHYGSPRGKLAERPRWMDATSLLRLESRKDPVDGLAWGIPLGDYVSIGISVDPVKTAASPTLLLDWVDDAWCTRGIDVRVAFPLRSAPVDLRYEHYHHERCYGRNWLLAGTSCCQFWFPSATGVATGLVAARLAPDVLRAPALIPPLYQAYLDQIASSHSGLEWLVGDDPSSITLEDLRHRSAAIISGNAKRLSGYLSLRNPPSELAFGEALLRMFEDSRHLANPLRIDSAPRRGQATRLFATSGEPDPWMDPPIEAPVLNPPDNLEGPSAILGLVDVLSGRRSIDSSAALVTPELRVHIDQFQLEGIEQWNAWVAWLRASERVTALELVPGALSPTDTDWRLTAQWRGFIGDLPSVSPQFVITFQMVEDRIAQIQTRRADHTFVLGDSILPPVAFVAMLGRLFGAIDPAVRVA